MGTERGTNGATVTPPARPPKRGQQGPIGPPIVIGGPTSTSWREHTLTRIAELRALADWVDSKLATGDAADRQALSAVRAHLDAAEQAAEKRLDTWPHRLKSALGGAMIERA